MAITGTTCNATTTLADHPRRIFFELSTRIAATLTQ